MAVRCLFFVHKADLLGFLKSFVSSCPRTRGSSTDTLCYFGLKLSGHRPLPCYLRDRKEKMTLHPAGIGELGVLLDGFPPPSFSQSLLSRQARTRCSRPRLCLEHIRSSEEYSLFKRGPGGLLTSDLVPSFNNRAGVQRPVNMST